MTATKRKKTKTAKPPGAANLALFPGESAVEGQTLTTQIIQFLQEDGRMPYSTIAAKLDVSEGTVRNRVRQLLDDNVITIQAEAMPAAFGYAFNTVTFVKASPKADIDVLAARFVEVPEAYYVLQMLGRYDLGIAAYHRSMDEYREYLNKNFYGREDVASFETMLNLKIHKLSTRWNLR